MINSESCMLNTGNWRLQKITFLATPQSACYSFLKL